MKLHPRSISATELSKLGKCEMLVLPQRTESSPRGLGHIEAIMGSAGLRSPTPNISRQVLPVPDQRNQAMMRGNAAHEAYEDAIADAHIAMMRASGINTRASSIAVWLSIALGIMVLMSALASA